MKNYLYLCLFWSMVSFGQTDLDTIKTKQLDEVTISSSKYLKKKNLFLKKLM